MFILANFLSAFAEVLNMVLQIGVWLILLRALLSWVNPDPYNPIVQFLYRVTEPVLLPIRQRLPLSPVDVSPIVAFLVILFAQKE